MRIVQRNLVRLSGCTLGLSTAAAVCAVGLSETAQAKELAKMRIVQYNVLSDSLDSPDHYTFCDPADLDHDTRFKRVVAQLEEQMKEGAVLCLQEVSRNWGGKLVPLFEQHGYTCATALTGSQFGGYMGQCIAWPTDKFKAIEVQSIRVSDTVAGWSETPYSKPAPPSKGELLSRLIYGEKPVEKPPFDCWKEAQKRHNAVVLARLEHKKTKKQFVVATYHMPCLFGSDDKCKVMTIHASLLFQQAQRFAKGQPLVVGGDFNIQPPSAQYDFITQGKLDNSHPQNPQDSSPLGIDLQISPMRSAYAVHSAEPEFTNLARNKFSRDGPFIETLDYIFLSDEISVEGIKKLPPKSEMASVQSYPSALEPSDHVMIYADLAF